MTAIQELHRLGQSIWLDYIRRDLLDSGELARLAAAGEVRGVTSNPTIFESAIAKGDLYDEAIRPLAQAGWEAERIFDSLAVEDIRAAADIFMPLYERTSGGDGFVSLEVNPRLAFDSQATLQEAQRLWSLVNRPNAMIKIPATQAGIPAIEQAICAGINVNVTLVFSLERYGQVMEAYLAGLEKRMAAGGSIDHVASVASFFVSRVDTLVDAHLEALLRAEGPQAERAAALLGKAAIANAKLAYAQFKLVFESQRFNQLGERGARVQRPLWASTSTKNPAYSDVMYVEQLIGPDTVNTLPPDTLKAFREHGSAAATVEQNLSASRAQIEALESLGISMEAVTAQLEVEGVQKFADSFESLLAALERRATAFEGELLPLHSDYRQALQNLEQSGFAGRLWAQEWQPPRASAVLSPGWFEWLEAPHKARRELAELSGLAEAMRRQGREQIGWVGAGPHADLAAATIDQAENPGAIPAAALDQLSPAAVRRFLRKTPVKRTLICLEETGFANEEWDRLIGRLWGRATRLAGEAAAQGFLALPHSGSELDRLVDELGIRRIGPQAPETVGVFAAFGLAALLPMQLAGAPVDRLLAGAARMAHRCRADIGGAANPGLSLGAMLAAAASAGRDILTLVADPSLSRYASWLGAALLAHVQPVLWTLTGEPVQLAGSYPGDRTLIYLRREGAYDALIDGWVSAGTPVIVLAGRDVAELGELAMRWQMAIAAASQLSGVQPAPTADGARWSQHWDRLLEARPVRPPKGAWRGEGALAWSSGGPLLLDAGEHLRQFAGHGLAGLRPGEVVWLHTYGEPNRAWRADIARLQAAARDQRQVAVLWHPRLAGAPGARMGHSSGRRRLIHLQLAASSDRTAAAPASDLDFEALHRARVWADYQLLRGEAGIVHGILLESSTARRELFAELVRAVAGAEAR